MITFGLILGAIATGAAILSFWDDLVNFAKECYYKLKSIVSGILEGFKAFVKWVGGKIQEIIKSYSRVGKQWQETTTTRVIDESEVPEDIRKRAKARQDEVDVTQELEMQMSN